ncbi:MAG: EF-P lysine aminoacylase GenX [Sandaracinaceae bacterium]|nr:EF-P lysine aminoacylase GenX [Sandaracinaceae bacterium]
MLLDRLRARAQVLSALRAFLDADCFIEVETPLAVPSPGLDVHLAALEVSGLGAPRWLATSPEYQMKRLLCLGLPRIYQISRCFRRGELGRHHEPEFTMLELYRAEAGSEELMRDTEGLVEAAARRVLGGTILPSGTDVAAPWARLTVDDAFREHAGVDVHDVLPDETRFFELLIDKVEPALEAMRAPVFLTRWPRAMASLARLCPDDARWADRFEAYVDGLELCNGFGELTDPVEQRARFAHDQAARREAGLDVYPVDERFLEALEQGMPESGGNAIGVDRVVMAITGAAHIEEVVAFPQSRL